MTKVLYNRQAVLTVTNSEKGQQITVENLRIGFKIEKTSESNPNTMKVMIYNLKFSNRELIAQTKNDVSLSIGYLGTEFEQTVLTNIFIGNVSRSQTEKKGPDFVTTIECEEKRKGIQESTFTKTYKPEEGKRLINIIRDLANKMGLIYKDVNVLGVDSEQKFKAPVTLSGPTKASMDEIVGKLGLTWNVQDGELHVRKPSDSSESEKRIAPLLTKDSGLIDIPIRREEGISFKALIDPLIKPNATVKIVSEQGGVNVNGFFVVSKAVYTGDTREGDWTVQCEAVQAA